MFTAKIKSKVIDNGVLIIYVDFSDGTNTLTEWCKPQNEDGFKYWVKSRLETLNAGPAIDTKYNADQIIDVSDPAPYQPTQAEIDEATWINDYNLWVRVKKNLVDTGVVDITNPKVQALLTKVKTNLKAAYIDKI